MSGPRASIVGVGVCAPLGDTWRQLAARAEAGAAPRELALPAPVDADERRARRLMSRSAALAAIATRRAITDAGWTEAASVGFYMGVGASGGDVAQIEALLRGGLRACNPLLAFQLMNNFTMCHAAILAGASGANACLFSRGAGTVAALAEACWALAEGSCTRALVGGADSAHHPVTLAELVRDGFLAEGLVPGEGAAILALADSDRRGALAHVVHVERGAEAMSCSAIDAAVVAAWSPAHAARLVGHARARGARRIVDTGAALGEALAATPALAWAAAVDLLAHGEAQTCAVLTAGVDGETGTVILEAAR